jgi:hypothetical protein
MHQLNKDDITAAVFPPANRKEDREPARPIAAAAAAETNSNNPGSVYDFSATKAETPPVPLQKSRREAAAKSPRQAAAGRCNDEMPMAAAFSEGPSSSSSSNKVGKQLVSTGTKLLPSQQLETKLPQTQHQQQQQVQQPPRHQQHHTVVAASGTGLAGSSSNGANAGSIYQNNPQLGYADSRSAIAGGAAPAAPPARAPGAGVGRGAGGNKGAEGKN